MRALTTAAALSAIVASCSLFTDTDELADKPALTTNDASVAPDGAADAQGSSSSDGALEASGEGGAVAYRDVVLPDGPIAYFPFDDAAGVSFTRDVVGGKLAEVVTKATFASSGVAGGAVAFDGTGHLDAGDVLDLIGASPFSIEVWVKATAGHLVHKRAGDSGNFDGLVFYMAAADTIKLEVWYPGGARGGWATLATDRFSHVVYSFDGQTLKSYVDAIGVASTYSEPGGAADNTVPLRIGLDLVGTIDELAFYDKPLTVEQVRRHYDAVPR